LPLYRTPDPACDLATFLRIGTQYRQAGELGQVPEKHLDQIYKWLDDVAALQAQIKPPAPPAPPPGAPGVPPGGAPMAPGVPLAA
jgi:hypothetical protein